MSAAPIRVAVIVASTREGRFGPTVATWFAGEAAGRADLAIDVVDLAETGTATAKLGTADAFVVVTPEYSHSYPAPLKAAIDGHFKEWQARPVGFVSYGGLSGGLRAVEHLGPVFAELHAVTVRNTVSFHGGRSCFGPDGRPPGRGGAQRRRAAPARPAHLVGPHPARRRPVRGGLTKHPQWTLSPA